MYQVVPGGVGWYRVVPGGTAVQVGLLWTQQNSRLANSRVLRHVQAVGGVGELWRPITSQDGHRGRWALPPAAVRRLDPQHVLLTGGQRSSGGPDLPGAAIHVEAAAPTWSRGWRKEGGGVSSF